MLAFYYSISLFFSSLLLRLGSSLTDWLDWLARKLLESSWCYLSVLVL